MRLIRMFIIIMAIAVIPFLLIACSGGKNPIQPNAHDESLIPTVNLDDNRQVIAIYDAFIDAEQGNFTIEPSSRMTDYHFPLSNLYPNVLKIVGYNWGPPFTAQIRLTHPLPTSGIDGYDPRVIACLPARAGVSVNFPTLQVQANNSVVKYPDGYTKLWDSTSIAGNTNPFIAYFQSQPYRVWSANNAIMETKTWELNLAGFGGSMQFKLIVDVSSNFPAPSTPITDNCPEPYKYYIQVGDGLNQSGGSATVDVFVYDWQGQAGIGGVKLEIPELFTGSVSCTYTAPGPWQYSYLYNGVISNNKYAPAGQYNMLVAAWDSATNVYSYNIVKVTVEASPANLTDITPDYLDFNPQDVITMGSRAYVAGGVTGFHIFDVSDPYNPTWLSRLQTPGVLTSVHVSGNYAYVTDHVMGLLIIDVTDPLNTFIVKMISLPSLGQDVTYKSGYAYVSTQYDGLEIIDVEPPASASIVNTFSTPRARGLFINANYLYLADSQQGLKIIDITNPLTAYIMNPDYPTYACTDVFVWNYSAFIISENNLMFSIWMVGDPERPNHLGQLDLTDKPTSIWADDDYAYITTADRPSYKEGHLHVIDVFPSYDMQIVRTLDTPGNALSLWMSGYFAYIADGEAGLFVVDKYYPLLSNIIAKVDTPGQSNKVWADTQYAYVADSFSGMRIVDVNPPEDAHLVGTANTGGYAYDVSVCGDWAFVADSSFGVQIIDITPPESAHIINTVDTPGSATGIYALGGLAFVADGSAGLQIMDVDPVESAYIMKTVDTPGTAKDVAMGSARVFVADYANGVVVVNTSNIPTAYISHTVSMTSYAEAVSLYGAHLLVANNANGLQVLDVSNPEKASIVHTVDTAGYAKDVCWYDKWAYVADSNEGFHVINIEDPEAAFIIDTGHTLHSASGICAYGQYVHVADTYGGLRIFSQW